MYKLIHFFDQCSPSDVGVGPSRFARFDNERPSPSDEPRAQGPALSTGIRKTLPEVVHEHYMQQTWGSMLPTNHLDRPELYENLDDDPFKEKEPKQRSGGGCSDSTCKKESLLEGLESVSEKNKGNVSVVAQEAAELAVSHRQEFLRGITIHHAQYNKQPNGRWDNKGRDMLDLFNPDKPGGERRARYEALKTGMEGAVIGIMISPPTVYDELNYIQVYKNNGDHIDLYAIEHRGDIEDLKKLYKQLAEEDTDVDFSKPIISKHDVSLKQIADTIEQSFVTEESKNRSRDYLERLRRDIANVHLINDYQKEAAELAEQIKLELLTKDNLRQGLAAMAFGLAAYANGETSDVIKQPQKAMISVVEVGQQVIGWISKDTTQVGEDIIASIQRKVAYTDGATEIEKNEVKRYEQHKLLVSLLDRNFGEKALQIFPTSPNKHGQEKNAKIFWAQTVQEQLLITGEESWQLLIYVQETWEQAVTAQEIIAFVGNSDTDTIGVGGAVFALGSLATLEFDAINSTETIQLEVIPEVFREKEEKIVINAEAIETILVQALDEQLIAVTKNEDEKKNKREETPPQKEPDVIVVMWLKEFIRTLDQKTPEEATETIEEEEENVVVTLEQLGEVFQEFFATENKEENTIEREIVWEFSLAVTLWMMLEFFSYYRSLMSLREMFKGIKTLLTDVKDKEIRQKEVVRIIKAHVSEGLIQKEPTQWLLLAIIWHLAMIREQGIHTTSIQTKKKKKKAAHSAGIIFAFNNNYVAEAQFVI